MDKTTKLTLLQKYDHSFPDHKSAWRLMVRACRKVGWKSFRYMVLDLQKELGEDKQPYKLKDPIK